MRLLLDQLTTSWQLIQMNPHTRLHWLVQSYEILNSFGLVRQAFSHVIANMLKHSKNYLFIFHQSLMQWLRYLQLSSARLLAPFWNVFEKLSFSHGIFRVDDCIAAYNIARYVSMHRHWWCLLVPTNHIEPKLRISFENWWENPPSIFFFCLIQPLYRSGSALIHAMLFTILFWFLADT